MVDQYRVLELPEDIEGDLFAADREGVDRDGRSLDRRPIFVRHFSLFSSKLSGGAPTATRSRIPASVKRSELTRSDSINSACRRPVGKCA
jgi:hypothetical protein